MRHTPFCILVNCQLSCCCSLRPVILLRRRRRRGAAVVEHDAPLPVLHSSNEHLSRLQRLARWGCSSL